MTQKKANLGVILDHRECRSSFAVALKRFGVNYSIENLETGDFQIGDRIIIERKTIRDLIDSIIDGRFIQQARQIHRTMGFVIHR